MNLEKCEHGYYNCPWCELEELDREYSKALFSAERWDSSERIKGNLFIESGNVYIQYSRHSVELIHGKHESFYEKIAVCIKDETLKISH